MPIYNPKAKNDWKAGDLCYFHKGEDNIVTCGRITRADNGKNPVAIIDNCFVLQFTYLFETRTEAVTALKK